MAEVRTINATSQLTLSGMYATVTPNSSPQPSVKLHILKKDIFFLPLTRVIVVELVDCKALHRRFMTTCCYGDHVQYDEEYDLMLLC